MALTDADRAEITALIRSEIAKALQQVAPPQDTGGLTVQNVGTPVDNATRRPLAADQCCNGCD